MAVRHAWGVPNTTHRYLIEEISGSLHPKVMLDSHYIGIFNSMCTNPKYSMRVMARIIGTDMRTVMGRTLHNLKLECNVNPTEDLSPALIKKSMKYSAIPEVEEWRVPLALELKDIREGKVSLR